jgi:hypothetical protein
MEFGLRDGHVGDHAFIIDTWVQCNRNSKMALDVGDIYVPEQKRLILRILLSKETKLTVAHVLDDEDAILGWAIGRPIPDPVVYYSYVRMSARRQKVACAMLSRLLHTKSEELPCLKVQFSHRPMTPSLKAPKAWRFNPYRNLDADVSQAARTSLSP